RLHFRRACDVFYADAAARPPHSRKRAIRGFTFTRGPTARTSPHDTSGAEAMSSAAITCSSTPSSSAAARTVQPSTPARISLRTPATSARISPASGVRRQSPHSHDSRSHGSTISLSPSPPPPPSIDCTFTVALITPRLALALARRNVASPPPRVYCRILIF